MNSDPSVELYPKDYCQIVTEITTPTCLEMSLAELWAINGYTTQETWQKIKGLTQDDVIHEINNNSYSEIFLFRKNFSDYLGGIEKDADGNIIGAKATTVHFYGQILLDDITEEDKKSNGFGSPVSFNLKVFYT